MKVKGKILYDSTVSGLILTLTNFKGDLVDSLRFSFEYKTSSFLFKIIELLCYKPQ